MARPRKIVAPAEQAAAITAAVAALTTEQVVVIGTSAVAALSTEALQNLVTDQVALLVTDQVATIGTADLSVLATEEAAALVTADVLALSVQDPKALEFDPKAPPLPGALLPGYEKPGPGVTPITVKMVRPEDRATGGPVSADVHPLEVQNWAQHGWVVADDEQ